MVKIGDRVKFLNDVGGGIVTGYLGKNMVYVENEDGFEVPYPVSGLINVDDPGLNKSEPILKTPEVIQKVQPKVREPEGGKIITGKEAPDFYFCIVPTDAKNPVGGDIRFFLVNDSNFNLLFRYAHYKNEQYKTIQSGELKPNARLELEVAGQDELNELPEYMFQLLYYKNQDSQVYPAIEKKFKINPVKFYKEKSFRPNALFHENALIFQISNNVMTTEIDKLTQDDLKKVVKIKEKVEPKKVIIKASQPEIIEIDLHVGEIIEDPGSLTNKEILDIQIDKVEQEMRAAIQSRARRIVFIHGVGQGVLKQEVARLLRTKFPKYGFQDASFKEYGFGATMVILKK